MKHKPSIEDILELSGIDILHPGGFEITKRIGEIVDMTGKKVLDVACGRGTLPCYYAREFRARITGIDLNPEMIESAVKKAASEGVEDLTQFQVGDALCLPFESDFFDVVINECAVGLTPDPQKCLNEMTRVTRHGGFVIIHENTWLADVVDVDNDEIARRIGTVPYTLSEWTAMMQESGLSDLWTEDWSGLENLYKMRHDRKVKDLGQMFSLGERLFNVFPKTISKYGLKGVLYVNESSRMINPLYANGELGYSLLKGQKPHGT
jgi:ubiquinone/menaquinone biosynthesis C-methylase UbiE